MPSTVYDAVNIYIKPRENQVKVETKRKGISSIKNISTDDLLGCFCKSASETKVIQSGFLPENCLTVNVSDNHKTVVIWHPALQCEFTYFKTLYENFPMPRMVFSFDINPRGQISRSYLTVIGDEKPKPKSQLYEYPFSNVFPDTGICVGAANSLPVYKELHTLASLPNLLLSYPNNDHLFKREHNKLNLGYRDLLEHMKDKPASYYYEHILVPRKDGMTLQDFIDRKIPNVWR